MPEQSSKKGVLLVVGDIPWHFTKLCHALGASLRRQGFEPHFLVASRYYERLAGVDFAEVGKVHSLADALDADGSTGAENHEIERWLVHTTFMRTRSIYGRHTNRWSDYRKLASVIGALFDAEPGLGVVWSEPPSGATTSLVYKEAEQRGIPFLGYSEARVPDHFNISLDAWFTQFLPNPDPPSTVPTGLPGYMTVNINALAQVGYLSLLEPRLRRLPSILRAGDARSLDVGGSQRGWQVRSVASLVARKARHAFLSRFTDTFSSKEEPHVDRLDVLFPLQFRPESTTSIQARFYEDDLQTIHNIAFSLPDHGRVFVKEHAAAVGNRSKAFYDALRDLPGVRLLDPHWPLRPRLPDFTAMVCLTTTAGFEALQVGLPVLLLGRTFYEDYPGVQRIQSWEELERALRALEPGRIKEPSAEPMRRYRQACFPGSFNYAYAAVFAPENVRALAAPICRVLTQGLPQ